MKKRKVLMIGLSSLLLLTSLSACKVSFKKNKQNEIDKVEEVEKPVEEGEIDLNSFYQWADVEDKFYKAEQEAREYEDVAYNFTKEEKDEYVVKIRDLLPDFMEGGTIYQVKDACELYKNALILMYTTTEGSSDLYYRLGLFVRAGILTIYGWEVNPDLDIESCMLDSLLLTEDILDIED